jgi:tRNA pseudouridine38-40 synthase
MVRYQVILAYDGAQFHGFQRQLNGRTVQEVVETALRKLNWQGSSILAAGRTDAGVHATGQVVAFDLEWHHPLEALLRAINANLPLDVSARQIRQVSEDFHPRYDALTRRYQYRLYCDRLRNPMLDRYAWRVWPAVQLSVLQEAAQDFVGCHDFNAFGNPPQSEGSTVRTVFQSSWQDRAQVFSFEVIADGFLYHMVRRMVAQQVLVAQGKVERRIIRQLLGFEGETASQVEIPSQLLAPARGLTLVEVQYPEQVFELDNQNKN